MNRTPRNWNPKKQPIEAGFRSSSSTKRAHIDDNASMPPPVFGSFMEVTRQTRKVRENIRNMIDLNRLRRPISAEQLEALFVNQPPRVSYGAMMINELGSDKEFRRLKARNIEESFVHTSQLFKQVTVTLTLIKFYMPICEEEKSRMALVTIKAVRD